MKKLLYFLLLYCCAMFGQAPILRVYLSDVQDNDNIPDATVTLEGFELEQIKGKYDKKCKCYYFDSVPTGYNTVMAYHKNYNEKGFQDSEGLPADIKLQLHDPKNVYYSFEEPVLTNLKERYTRKTFYRRKIEEKLDRDEDIYSPTFRYLYEEDPYHIAVITSMTTTDFFNNDSIKKALNEMSLEQSQSVQETSPNTIWKCFAINNVGEVIVGSSWYLENGEYINQCDSAYELFIKQRILFFNKKNRDKFNRYNSPEIKKLRDMGIIVTALTYREIEYYGKAIFNYKKFYNIDSPFFTNDSISTVNPNYFLSGLQRLPRQTIFNNLKEDASARYYGRNYDYYSDENVMYSIYFVMPLDENPGIGLGVLDSAIKKDLEEKEFFTNRFKSDIGK